MNFHKKIILIFGIILFPFVSLASEQDVRAQCFSTLRENMEEAKIFSTPLQELKKMSYGELEPMFSVNYKNLSSFGIEIDRGDLEMRLYSFGEQTGYVHPLDLPIPASIKSDKWKEPAKEFIVAEEFIVDQESKKHFLNCAFFTISSSDLLGVTSDRYLYDGPAISITKVSKEGDYKAWYSENISYDYSNKPFVTWKRLFIYPKLTQNDYFNRYDVAEVFPANKAESFDVLKFFLEPILQIQEYDSAGSLKTAYFKIISEEEEVRVSPPEELIPPVPAESNKEFPLSAYYQAIENMFPQFAERLALRGALKYDTFKRLSSVTEKSDETTNLLNIINDYRGLAVYDLDKKAKEKEGMNVSNPEMEASLQLMMNAETVAQDILLKNRNSSVVKILSILGPILLVLLGLFLLGKKGNDNKFSSVLRRSFLWIFLVVIAIILFLQFGAKKASADRCTTRVTAFQTQGYVCVYDWEKVLYLDVRQPCAYTCTLTTATYSASILSSLSIEGLQNTSQTISYVTGGYNSPFIYFKNLPKGNTFVSLDSKLDEFLPKPFFNNKYGWVIKPKGDNITVSGKEENHLFYELAVDKISLVRNGRNFASKTEIISFLEDSDFLEKLGLSEVEKKNSLDYFIPKIQSAESKNYYYLTVLTESAINEISSLNIKPKPENIERLYFALYPTDVPIKTEGDFIFPKITNHNNDYSVKETGEILVYPSMWVLWDKNYKK
ncbi:hypothetical protein EPN27_01495 [Patescibacteria group bacterium]|nr:MAG: hypothetical protein EPN27_01495 [Patescibacteria group bacterium]